jgi:hypothetical protein
MTTTFEELPEDGAGWRVHRAHAARLREHPGQWAAIGTYATRASATSFASMARRGYGAYVPRRAFEAEVRTVDGEHLVYARYVGHLEGTLLLQAAARLVACCPEHGDRDARLTACHCAAAVELRAMAAIGEEAAPR